MKKCKDCNADCVGMCMYTWEPIEDIDTKGAFLFWPCIIFAVIGLVAWWLS